MEHPQFTSAHAQPATFPRGLLAILVALVVLTPRSASGGNLPSTVSTGNTYVSLNDTISTSGTQLDVVAMLSDTNASGLPTASFTAIRTQFLGLLRIVLPTSLNTWSNYGVTMRIQIKDGYSGTTVGDLTNTLTEYIRLTGVLSWGSSVTVTGGTYTYSNMFLNIPSPGLALSNTSSLTIVEGNYRSIYPTNITEYSYLVLARSGITMSTTSSLTISNNTIWAFNVSTSGSWYWFVFAPYNGAPLSVSGASMLSISGNHISSRDVSVGTYWTSAVFYPSFNCPITLTGGSSIYMSHNVMTASHIVKGSLWFWYLFFPRFSIPVVISPSSSFTVFNTTMSIINTVTPDLVGILSFAISGTYLQVDGLFLVKQNNITLTSTTYLAAVVKFEKDCPLSGSGTLRLEGNVMTDSAAGSVINLEAGSPAPTSAILTCDNYLNGALCEVHSSGTFSCGLGASLMGRVSPCHSETQPRTATNMITHTPTNPPTLTHLDTHTTTHSSALSQSSTSTWSKETASLSHQSRSETILELNIPTPTVSSSTTATHHTQSPSLSSPVTPTSLTLTRSTQPTLSHPPSNTRTHSSTKSIPNTLSRSLIVPPATSTFCNYSCLDVISIQVLPPGLTPKQAAEAYWASHNRTTLPKQSCSSLTVPFVATSEGASMRVLIHVSLPTGSINITYPIDNQPAPTSPADKISAITMSSTMMFGAVVVMDVRRTDKTPLSELQGSLALPSDLFRCKVGSTNGEMPHGGLPWAAIVLEAPVPALTKVEKVAIAAVSMASADLQTVAAIGMLRCSPGADTDVESEAGVRALVPVALSATCLGAVQGALLSVGAASLLSLVAICAARQLKGLGWAEAAAMTRCPGIVIAVWAFLQMGLVVCGARLVTAADRTAFVLGVVGVLTGAMLPIVCILLAWGFVSRRCYRLAQMPEAVAGRHKGVVWVRSALLPSYQLDASLYPISKAFSTVVGRTRLPSCLWAGLPVIQPVVMVVVVFAEGGSCNASLVTAGIVVMLVGAVLHVYFRPHRIPITNHLQGIAMALNAAILLVASQLVSNPLNVSALAANRGIAMLQVGFSGCRFLHTLAYLIYMKKWGQEVFCICEPDGKFTALDTNTSPVFDIQAGCCKAQKGFEGDETIHHTAPLMPRATSPTITSEVAVLAEITHNAPCPPPTAPHASPVKELRVVPHTITRATTNTPTGPKPSSRLSTLLYSPKTNKKFSDSIVSSLINCKNGHVPMERPYTLLWEEEEDDNIVMPPNTHGSISDEDGYDDDLGLELEDISNSHTPPSFSSSSSREEYIPSSSTSQSTILSI